MAIADLRREDARLLRGEGAFVADVDRPHALAAAFVRSPVAYGRITSIDPTEAMALPGVHAVLTASDLDPLLRIPIRRAGRPGMEAHLQPALASGDVRYVGEPVAVVVADDAYVAELAAERVGVEIDALPAATSVDHLGDPARGPWGGEPLYTFECTSGDPAGAFAAADVVVELETVVGRQTGLPMETRGVIAEWDGSELHLWGPAKFVNYTTQVVGELLGLAPGSVHTHKVDVGGMFGPRGELYPEDLVVPLAARVVGRPVRWVEDRREHLMSINHSRGQHQRLAVAARSDGTLLGFRASCRLDVGAYTRPIGARLGELVVETLPGPYRWNDFEVECTGVLTNKTPTGTMRGPSGLESNLTRERAIDLLADRLGEDPIEIRRRNLIRPDELPFTRTFGGGVHNIEYDGGDFPATFDEIVAQAGDAPAPAPGTDDVVRARGISAFVEASGIGAVETVEVALLDDGSFRVGTSASEIGQGLASMLAGVVSRELGVPAELVAVDLGSSAAHAGGSGTYGSRTTIFTGSAAIAACRELVEELTAEVVTGEGVAREALTTSADGVVWDGGARSWATFAPRRVVGEHRAKGPTFGFGAVVVDAAIDAATGITRIPSLTVGYDCGKVLDRTAVEGQLRGAAVQGLGGSLLEELPYDEDGQPLATTFMDYLVPTCAEAPDVRVVVVESGPVAGNPLGVRGVGEAGLVGVGAAVANAVARAAGGGPLPVERLPLRPQDVARALGAGPRSDAAADASSAPSPRGPSTAATEVAPGRRPAVVAAALAAVVVAVAFLRRRKRT